jgi:hypothetical protein
MIAVKYESLRRRKDCSFAHHLVAAALIDRKTGDASHALRLLDLAAENGWTEKELRQQVANVKALTARNAARAVVAAGAPVNPAVDPLDDAEVDNPVPVAGPVEPAIDVRHADFRDLDLAPGSIDCIITDPPYPAEFLPLYSDLAERAAC